MTEKGAKIVVTGGAGFIGSHACEALVKAGLEVHAIDNLTTGQKGNLASLSGARGFTFHDIDITDARALATACEGATVIFHYAALTSVPESVAAPVACAQTNVMGFLNVLEAARHSHTPRVVYASSSAVYGKSGEGQIKEDQAGEPKSPYGLSKLANEQWAALYAKQYDMTTVGLRFFNIYGPRQLPDGAYAAVIPKFIEALEKKRRPLIFGDGSQTRDFVCVTDAVEACLRAATIELDSGASVVVNVGAGRPTSILELFETVRSIYGRDLAPDYAPARPGDILHSCASADQAKRLLRFSPSVSLREGLKETVAWFQSSSPRSKAA